MARVASRGGHDGRRRAVHAAGARPLRQALVYLVAAVVALAAWVLCVRAAIQLGQDARDSPGVVAWALTGLVTLGAAICLLLVFMLLARVRNSWAARRRRVRGRHL